MKNLIVDFDDQHNFRTYIENIPTLTADSLASDEVLIKVSVAGSNPKDLKHALPSYFNNHLNQGDDCAGTIAAVGSAVKGFTVGERVAGFHVMDTLHGTYAEYTICPANTVFRIPDSMSDEEAATIPLVMFTAAVGLYRNLQLPAPWDRSDELAPNAGKIPLVVNAASGSVGSFAIKLAKLNPKIGPIIATAGSSADYVRSLGVDAVIDYRSPTISAEIKAAAGGKPIKHIFDAANSLASVRYLSAVLTPNEGRYTSTLPITDESLQLLNDITVWHEQILVSDVHAYGKKPGMAPGTEMSAVAKQWLAVAKKPGGVLFGEIMSRTIERALADGELGGQPYEVVPKGLEGVKAALEELRDRKKGGNGKFVARIADTPEL